MISWKRLAAAIGIVLLIAVVFVIGFTYQIVLWIITGILLTASIVGLIWLAYMMLGEFFD